MPLPSTGSISLSQVNTEVGFSATAAISMNDIRCRSLAGNGTTIASGTSWGLGTIRGRSWNRYSQTTPTYFWYTDGTSAYINWNNVYVAQTIGGTLTSYTIGGYTYYRGPYQQTTQSGGGEGGGAVSNIDWYSVARA